MKRLYITKLIIPIAIFLGSALGAVAQTTVIPYSGSMVTYTVPSTATSLGIDAIGACGGFPYISSGTLPVIYGGRVQCTLAVTGGQVLYIYVGGAGQNWTSSIHSSGGYNGGGGGGSFAADGGGATDIRTSASGTTYTGRLIVAGGGGGGGDFAAPGGVGGGLTGGTAPAPYGGSCGGGQTGPGCGTGYVLGTFGQGGTGNIYSIGGGGGGYWGGNAGVNGDGGAGGGSSYTNPSFVTGVVHTQGYTGANGNGKVTITVLCTVPVAGSISGTTTLCNGASSTLTDVSGYSDAVWVSSNPSVAAIGSTSGALTSVSAGTSIISYLTVRGCGTALDVTTVTINPSVTSITGNTSLCTGNSAIYTGVPSGGTWISSNPGVAGVGSSSGNVSGFVAGFSTITYTLPAGCFGTLPMGVNTSPSPITGSGVACVGLTTSMSDATTGGAWTSGNPAVAAIGSVSGVATGVSAGTAPITYTMPLGCTAISTVTINPLPAVNAVTATGGNSFCSGGVGVPIGLNGSVAGLSYQLYNNGLPAGTMTGPGGAFSFGLQTAGGTYTASATNLLTGCASNMSGSQTITINPLPAVNSITTPDGSSYCTGGSGVHIGLNGSVSGVNYQLSLGATPVYSVSGSGSAVSFGVVTATGTYTAMAIDAVTGCTKNMAGSATIAINPLPTSYSVTGGGGYCVGGNGVHVGLSYSTAGVSYQLFNGASGAGSAVAGVNGPLDFGLQTASGTNYHVVATNLTTNCVNNMSGTATVAINPLPTPNAVTLGGHYCAGGTGVLVGLGGSVVGTSYQAYVGTTPMGGWVPGSGGAISFGLQTVAGSYTAKAMITSTGCTANMPGSAAVTIDPLPIPYVVTGGGNYCSGGTGVPVGLSGSDNGISYQLYYMGVALGSPVAGTGGAFDFGMYTGSGAYTVIATNVTTGCVANMTGGVTVTINPLPSVFAVTGGGNYCIGGSGLHVGLSYSNTGVIYQLNLAGSPLGLPVTGTGAPIDFGILTTTGNYTVTANNTITGCSVAMSGSAAITTSPLPNTFAVTGGGNYCSGDAGLHVGLRASNTGINYQLYSGGLPVGSVMAGTGGSIDFGLQTAAGSYTAVAVNASTACASNMTGMATIGINPLPSVYTVSGGGSYCQGAGGVHIGVSSTESGVMYKLMRGSVQVGSTMSGSSTGAAVDFGLQTVAGAYTVMAVNGTTSCTSQMSGTATVIVNALPVVYTVTGGGNVCSGSTGAHVNLSGSNAGINYQLMLGSGPLGSVASGTGAAIDFGPQTTTGSYTVLATDAVTGCSAHMAASATVIVNPTPTPYAVAGGGNYCAGGVGVHVGITASDRGVTYQLYNGTSSVGIPWYGTGSAIDFGTYAVPGSYSVMAINESTGCGSTMSTSVPVAITPLVTPSVTMVSDSGLTVCSGYSVGYTATPINGGTSPMYQWSVGGVPVSGATNPTYNYAPANGDVVAVTITSNADCATPAMATVASMMNVITSATPNVTIASNLGDHVCAGTPVLYTASPTYGGSAPSYTWMVGSSGTVIGYGLAVTYIPHNGDNVYCHMISNYACRLGTAPTSNSIDMTITPPTTPVFTITGSTNAGLYQLDTLMVNVTAGGGPSPSFQWYVNGVPVQGAVTNLFAYSQFNNKDSVACVVTSSGTCGGAPASHYVIMNVRNLGVTSLSSADDISVIPNPNNGTFTIKGVIGTSSDEVSIEVTNVLGQVVYKNKVMTSNGSINEQVSLNSAGISKGMYLLNLRSGTDAKAFRIVVEK